MASETAYSLKLALNASDLTSGLAKITGIVTDKLGGVASAAGSVLTKLGPAAIVGTIGAGIGVAVAAFGGALESAYKSYGKLQSIGRGASALGIDVESFQALTGVFAKVGVEGDAVGATLAKLGGKVSQAAGGNKELQAVFESMGIDAQKIVALPLDQQFKAIADGMAKLPPGGRQAAAAMKLFEEAGVKLLPALQKGGAGVDAFLAKQKSLGGIFTANEIAMASRAKMAWGQATGSLSALWENFKAKALVSLAPIIEAGGKVLQRVVDFLTPLVPVVQQVFDAIAEVAVPLFDDLADFFGGMVTGVMEWGKSLFDIGGTLMSVRDVVMPILNGLGQGFATIWDAVKAGAGALSMTFGVAIEGLADLVIAYQDSLKDMLRTMKTYSFAFGAAGVALQFVDIEKLGEAGAAVKQLGRDWQQWGTAQIDAFGASAQAVDAWFAKLDARKRNEPDFAGGDIPDAAGQWEDMNKRTKAVGYVGTAAVEAGSQAALTAMNRFRFDMSSKDDTPKRQLNVAQASHETLKNIYAAMSQRTAEVW